MDHQVQRNWSTLCSEESGPDAGILLYLAEMQSMSTSMEARKTKAQNKAVTSHDIHLPPSKPPPSSLTCSASLPATPLLNTHAFESAYYLPDRLTYPGLSSETLNVPDPGMHSEPLANSDRWTQSTPSQIRSTSSYPSYSVFTMSDTDSSSSALLDVSLVTDTSSMLDDSLPAGRFLPATPPVEHIRPDIHTQTPQSASGLLLGLGVTGLFLNDRKPFDGMGLLSEQFVNLGRGDGDDAIEDEDEDQDTGPSQRFLQEVLLTFSQNGAPPRNHTDMFLASPAIRETAAFAKIPPTSIPGFKIQRPRDPSVSTISSQMKCLPKKLKDEKAAQKGRCVGPAWRP